MWLTNYPCSGINHTPFSSHQNAETLASYCVTITRLVAALLRGTFIFPSSADLEFATQLYEADPNDQECLHDLLKALWLQEWVPHGSNCHDPTMAFLALLHLQPGGDWSQPKAVTGSLAQLMWGIRLVSVHEAVNNSDAAKTLLKLAPFYQEGHHSTFHNLMSLQHYATTTCIAIHRHLPEYLWNQAHTAEDSESPFLIQPAADQKRWTDTNVLPPCLLCHFMSKTTISSRIFSWNLTNGDEWG